MDADRFSESTQFARKLQQAVLSLRPGAPVAHRQIPRMAQALALAEMMAAKARDVQIRPMARAAAPLGSRPAAKASLGG